MGANQAIPLVRQTVVSYAARPVESSPTLKRRLRLQIRASYRGEAAEQWLRACLQCLRVRKRRA